MIGRVRVSLLDTQIEVNDPADRELTARLYTSEPEWRLKQEWVLGVGGVRVLRALGINPEIWHANEGHAAFMYVERLRELLEDGVTLADAKDQIRNSSVFTTHTPVTAGHEVFTSGPVERGTGPVLNRLGITPAGVMALGAADPNRP